MDRKIAVIHEPTSDEPFLIVNKPKHLPSAPLCSNDDSAYGQAEKMFPALKEVTGKKAIEHGLVHRIDTETDGLLLIASTQEFYDFMQLSQADGKFVKHYRAVCHLNAMGNDSSFPQPPFWGVPGLCPVDIESRFRYYGPKNSLVRPVTERSSRIVKNKAAGAVYKTSIRALKQNADSVEALCSIDRGFKHQVRCHLAWCGLSVYGDDKYSLEQDSVELQFSAVALEFPLHGDSIFSIKI